MKTRENVKSEMFNYVWTSIQRYINSASEKSFIMSEIVHIPDEEAELWNQKELKLQEQSGLDGLEMVCVLNEVKDEINLNLEGIGWKFNEEGDLERIS